MYDLFEKSADWMYRVLWWMFLIYTLGVLVAGICYIFHEVC